MADPTPSPSAQELADKLDNIAKHDCTCSYAKALRLSATLLRRLAETERERDEARRLAVNYRNEIRALRDERNAAESERDALREMLAQADAAISMMYRDSSWFESDLPTAAQEALARHRQRLAEKDKE